MSRPGRPRYFAPLGEPQRKIEQPLRGLARDDQRLARLVLRDDAFAHRREQAFGRFADQHEVDAVLCAPTIGLGTPGTSRAGRTPA